MRTIGSDIVYLGFFGSSILAVNSLQVANELLDKKGAVYSSRPRLPYLKELYVDSYIGISTLKLIEHDSAGWGWNLVLMDYGRSFVVHRRIVQQHFQANVVTKSYQPIIEHETKILLGNLLRTPKRFVHHLKRFRPVYY